ncbi:MAG: NYN domain-containing protein [Candidatus Peregrinibacteria bacterium]|nr:NYN domain-containing protein [Candidatus Peregrinibacteria bacterium]
MERVIVFIDGHNLYSGIKNCDINRYKWCDLKRLCKQFLKKDQNLKKILYCSALCTWNKNKRDRHKKYIKIIKDTGVDILMGRYNEVSRNFNQQMKIERIEPATAIPPNFMKFKTYEEKKTDVNIALKIFEYAYLDEYDHAFIISGDSDLIPAIELAQKHFGKKFTCIMPPNIKGKEIQLTCMDGKGKIKEKTLKACVLKEEYTLKNGEIINIPIEYNNPEK